MTVLRGESGPTEYGWSQLKEFQRCPKAYQFRFIRQIYHPLRREPDHFAIGSLLHAGRACWFASGFKTDGKTLATCQLAILQEEEKLKLPATLKASHIAASMFAQYVDHWRVRPHPDVKATEYLLGPFMVADGLPRTSKPDDVGKYPEGGALLWLGDLKTSSGDVSDVIKEYELNGQFILGMLGWDMATQGFRKMGPAAGYMLDIAIKPKDETGKCKFSRYAIRVTDWSKEWFLKSTKYYLKQMAGVTYDSWVPRNAAGCVIAGTRTKIDCDYKLLCKMGKSAAGQYVKGKGERLDEEDWK